jgi:uncharacterized membrane protein YfcA
LDYLLLVVVGIVAGVMGGIIVGGGLLTMPLLFFLDLDASLVIGTSSVASLTTCLSATGVFARGDKIKWKTSAQFTALAIPASLIGSWLVLVSKPEDLKKYVAIVILLCVPLLFKDEKFGLERKEVSKAKYAFGMVLYFIAMINATVVPAGAALVTAILLIGFMGMKIIEAHATSLPAWVVLLSIACTVFFLNDKVLLPYALVLGAACFVGGILGARIAMKMGNKWVRTAFVFVVLTAAFKMIFEL